MIYRVEYYCECESSEGVEYFPSLRKARKAMAKYKKERDTHDPQLQIAKTPKTKKEIISLLNNWGGHPDNG